MISIVISSANPSLLKQVTENIEATIGTPYQLIATNNSEGKQGICEVYNNAIAQAQYDIICFIHEDIIIKTQNWGIILKNIFDEHPQTGLVGVAGGGYKPIGPSTWGGFGINNSYVNILQSYKHADQEPKLDYRNPDDVKLARVACVDGVWLATTKKIANEFKFDEATFKGFHVYDIDYSLTVGQKYEICVTYEILINHLSEGHYSREWVIDTLTLYDKWKEHLPINIVNFNYRERRIVEKITFKRFIDQLKELGFPASVALNWLRTNQPFKDMKLYWKLVFYTYKVYYLKG